MIKIIEYILLILTVCFVGCVMNCYLYEGMPFNQTETLYNDLKAGNYNKQCRLTRFIDIPNYNWVCNWQLINQKQGE